MKESNKALKRVVLVSFTHLHGSHVLSPTWPVSAAEAWASVGSMDPVGPHGSRLHGMCPGKRAPEVSHSLSIPVAVGLLYLSGGATVIQDTAMTLGHLPIPPPPPQKRKN